MDYRWETLMPNKASEEIKKIVGTTSTLDKKDVPVAAGRDSIPTRTSTAYSSSDYDFSTGQTTGVSRGVGPFFKYGGIDHTDDGPESSSATGGYPSGIRWGLS